MDLLAKELIQLIGIFIPIVVFVIITIGLSKYFNNLVDNIMDLVSSKIGFWGGIIFSILVFIGTIIQST
jgi:Na+-translocating ferredoxin:NAD+ oxidoreductase RnfE subunit